MSDDREKLEVAKEVCGRLERENAELLTAITELRPDPVLVEGSFIPVADWPVILGNFMRGSAENARQAKAAHIQMIDFKAERDGLLATVETVREIASKRVRDPQLGFGGPPDDMPLEDDYVNFGEFYVAEEIRAALTTSPAQSLANLQAALVLEYIDSPEHATSLREARAAESQRWSQQVHDLMAAGAKAEREHEDHENYEIPGYWFIQFEDLDRDCDGTYPIEPPLIVLAEHLDEALNIASGLAVMPEGCTSSGVLIERRATWAEIQKEANS